MLRLLSSLNRSSRLPRFRARLGIGLVAVALTAGAAGAATGGGAGQPKLRVPNLTGLRATAPSGLLSGPDVSSNNHGAKKSIKWGQVAGGGRAFTIVKATGERGYTNPWFKRDWEGAGQAGLIRAAYHFAIPSKKSGDAAKQAKNFVTVVSSAGGLNNAGTLPLVLDLEQTGGLRPAALQTWVRSFLTTVEKLTHRPPMIYTYNDFWRHQMGNAKTFTHYPLWIASYTAHPPSPLPGGWPSWALWQYTANGRLAGVRGPVDLSVFCCSAQTLTTLADGRPLPVLQRWIATGGLNGPLGAPIGPLVTFPAALAPLTPNLIIPPPTTPAAPPTASPTASSASPTASPGSPGASPATSATPGASTTPSASPTATPSTTTAAFPGGSAEDFVGGSIYASPAGTFIVKGITQTRYLALGGPTGPLGFPTADTAGQDPTGSFAGAGQSAPAVTPFTGGTLVAAAAAPAYLIQAGPMLDRWSAEGGMVSTLGLPIGDTTPVAGGSESLFAGGALTTSTVRGTHELSGKTLLDWLGYGGAASVYGLPSSDIYATATGTRTDFGAYSISELF